MRMTLMQPKTLHINAGNQPDDNDATYKIT